MRPTVLKTPELAAENTIVESQRLPGISAAAAEDARDQRKLVEAQRKSEQKQFKEDQQYDGFFNPEPGKTNAPATNAVPLTSSEPSSVHPEAQNSRAAAPLDADAQEKARAALAEKMVELESTNAPASK
jgi:hypothetical protein